MKMKTKIRVMGKPLNRRTVMDLALRARHRHGEGLGGMRVEQPRLDQPSRAGV